MLHFSLIDKQLWPFMTEDTHCLHTYIPPSSLIIEIWCVQLTYQGWSYWESWSLPQFWKINHKWPELIIVIPSFFPLLLSHSDLSWGHHVTQFWSKWYRKGLVDKNFWEIVLSLKNKKTDSVGVLYNLFVLLSSCQ